MSTKAIQDRWNTLKSERFAEMVNIGLQGSLEVALDVFRSKQPFFDPKSFALDYLENYPAKVLDVQFQTTKEFPKDYEFQALLLPNNQVFWFSFLLPPPVKFIRHVWETLHKTGVDK